MKGSQDIEPEVPNTKLKVLGNNLKTTCSSYFLLSNFGRNLTLCMKVRESLAGHIHLYTYMKYISLISETVVLRGELINVFLEISHHS